MSQPPRPSRGEPAPAGDPDQYLTVTDGPGVELREKGSRFLAVACFAPDREAAQTRLESVRRAHFDATHHCWALRLSPPEQPIEHSEDDGEPSGTAGVPILNAMRRAGLLDCQVIVVRWFGGVKLGTGGLARAYGACASQALAAAGRRQVWRTAALQVDCAYEDVGAVEAVLARAAEAVRQVERVFEEHPKVRILVLAGRAQALGEALREATAGRARISLEAGAAPPGRATPPPPRSR